MARNISLFSCVERLRNREGAHLPRFFEAKVGDVLGKGPRGGVGRVTSLLQDARGRRRQAWRRASALSPPFLSPSLSPFGSRILSRVVQSTDPISQHCRRPSCSYLLVLVAGYVANFRREGFGCKMSRAFSVFRSFVSVQDSPRLLQNAVGERAHEAVSLWKMLMNSF